MRLLPWSATNTRPSGPTATPTGEMNWPEPEPKEPHLPTKSGVAASAAGAAARRARRKGTIVHLMWIRLAKDHRLGSPHALGVDQLHEVDAGRKILLEDGEARAGTAGPDLLRGDA